MKEGGAVIYPLKGKDRNEGHRVLLSHASMICDWVPAKEMAGWAIVGWGFDGTSTCGYKVHQDSVVKPSLIPSYISDVIRRRMINEGEWD